MLLKERTIERHDVHRKGPADQDTTPRAEELVWGDPDHRFVELSKRCLRLPGGATDRDVLFGRPIR